MAGQTPRWELPYRVFDTPCYPARWKVGRFEGDSNATSNYFRDRRKAEAEALRRNAGAVQREEALEQGAGRQAAGGALD